MYADQQQTEQEEHEVIQMQDLKNQYFQLFNEKKQLEMQYQMLIENNNNNVSTDERQHYEQLIL